jgi:heme/copper-type cytochrome/quinol oxidase subunit 2
MPRFADLSGKRRRSSVSRKTQRNFFLMMAAACFAIAAPSASAVNWWLPENYSVHGKDVDYLFAVIFWLTTVVMLGVFAVMIYFIIKYRFNPERKKAHYSHGNPKLEMIWTIIPAIILTVISLYSKGVWDTYRHGNPGDTRKVARVLVIGEQFQWNVIYAGPDGKIGKYLIFPKPSDKYWPKNADGTPFTMSYKDYQETKGPADMPYEDAVGAIDTYIGQENPLGKVFDDPDGKDDNWEKQPGRPIYLPKDRPIEVQLSSKDVIHDFFLPNFRVKLDAVPGLRGVINFTATTTSKSLEENPANRMTFKNLDELTAAMKRPGNKELLIAVTKDSQPLAPNAKSAGAFFDARAREWKYNDAEGKTILRQGQPVTEDRIAALKAIGVKDITVYHPGYFDLVCEELCGQGHYKMQGQVIILTPEEYAEQFETAADSADAGRAEEKSALSRK